MSSIRDPEEIQTQIEQTRGELGETVEALAQKADVKAQAKQRVAQTKASVAGMKDELLNKAPDGASSAMAQASNKVQSNPLPAAAVGAFAAGFVFGRLTKR